MRPFLALCLLSMWLPALVCLAAAEEPEEKPERQLALLEQAQALPPLPISARTFHAAVEEAAGTGVGVWRARSEVLWLYREAPASRILVFNTGKVNAVVLTNRDADLASGPALRLTLGKGLRPRWGLETTYFGFHQYSDSHRVTETLSTLVPTGRLANLPGLGPSFTNAQAYAVDYDSALHSIELNLVRDLDDSIPGLSVLFGLRYTDLTEEFNLGSAFYDEVDYIYQFGRYAVHTENDLLGLQMGLRHVRPLGGQFQLECTGKAGLFVNWSQLTSTVTDTNGPLRTKFHDSECALAQMYELGVCSVYQMGPNSRLGAGYNLVYLRGVALAAEQFETRLQHGGSVLMHGPSLFFETEW